MDLVRITWLSKFHINLAFTRILRCHVFRYYSIIYIGIVLYHLVITLTDDIVVTHQRVYCVLSIVLICLQTMRSCLREIIHVYIEIRWYDAINYYLLRNFEIYIIVSRE